MTTLTLRQSGVTLIELLVALAILTITLGISVPAIDSLIQANTKAHTVNNYFGIFAYARHQAVTTRTITAVCPLDANNQCIDDWNRPVSVFPDSNRDGHPDNQEIWRMVEPGSNHLSIHSRTSGRGSLHFGPDGMVHGAAGSIVICPDDLSTGHMTYVAVSRGGRARKVTDDDGDGIIRLSWGGVVRCR